MHGANGRVRDNARERLQAMVLPALAAIRKLIDQADSDSVRLAAIRDILDRTGYKPTDKVEQSGDTRITVEYIDKGMTTPPKTAQNGHLTTSRL